MDPLKQMLLEVTAAKLIDIYYHPKTTEAQRERVMEDVDKIKEDSAEAEAKKAIAKMMSFLT